MTATVQARANGCEEHSQFRAGCDACIANGRAYQRARRRAIAYGRWQSSLVDAEPAVEMLRELVANGWTLTALADRLGRRIMPVSEVVHGQRRQVTGALAGQISDLYDELICYPPPTGRGAALARTVAARHGWKPPTDQRWRPAVDVDQVVVARAAAGEDPGRPLGAAERSAAVQRAVAEHNHTRAAEVLGVAARTVLRHEARRRDAPFVAVYAAVLCSGLAAVAGWERAATGPQPAPEPVEVASAPPPKRLRPHGTPAAAQRHYSRGEELCDECGRRERERWWLVKRVARARKRSKRAETVAV